MRNIPIVTKNLLIINVLAFIAMKVFQAQGIDLNDLLGLHFFLAKDFRIWQFITYLFMHANFMHILFNMFSLWMFGQVVENVWGPKKFLIFYLICGVGAGFCQELAQYGSYIAEGMANYDTVGDTITGNVIPMSDYLNSMTTVGASGAIYGVLLAFGMLFPNERMFIIPIPVPIKAKWLVMGYAVIELFSAIGTSGDGVAHLAHLGGMLFGFLLIRYWRKHPYTGYQDFGMNRGRQFFDRMKNNWEQRTSNRKTTSNQGNSWSNNSQNQNRQTNSDWDYNARKRAEQAEVDKILDKIRKSGYDSLTKEEKKRLFENSKNM